MSQLLAHTDAQTIRDALAAERAAVATFYHAIADQVIQRTRYNYTTAAEQRALHDNRIAAAGEYGRAIARTDMAIDATDAERAR